MSDIKTQLIEALQELIAPKTESKGPKQEVFVVQVTTQSGTTYKEMTAAQASQFALRLLVKEPGAKIVPCRKLDPIALDLDVKGVPATTETTEGGE